MGPEQDKNNQCNQYSYVMNALEQFYQAAFSTIIESKLHQGIKWKKMCIH